MGMGNVGRSALRVREGQGMEGKVRTRLCVILGETLHHCMVYVYSVDIKCALHLYVYSIYNVHVHVHASIHEYMYMYTYIYM